MFLANENFPAPSIQLLRDYGIAVVSIREEFPGIADQAFIEIAIKEKLIILTFDKDYGELIFRDQTDSAPSALFFRSKGERPEWAGEMLLDLLSTQRVLTDCFTIVEQNGIRQRFYQ